MEGTMIFATLVSLVCNFAQEKRASKDSMELEFVQWLRFHNHEELVAILEDNSSAMTALNNLMFQNQETTLQEIEKLHVGFAKLASSIRELEPLHSAIIPDHGLSVQAIRILQQLVEKGATEMFPIKLHGFTILNTSDGNRIEIEDQQFLHSDLVDLVDCGMLKVDGLASSKQIVYYPTRIAQKFVNRQKVI